MKIAPSILAANTVRLEDQVREAESGGADLIHVDVTDVDVTDGHYRMNLKSMVESIAAQHHSSSAPVRPCW